MHLKILPSNQLRNYIAKIIMAITKLERKGRRNVAIAINRQTVVKQITRKPIIRKVDVEAIKASFAEKKANTQA